MACARFAPAPQKPRPVSFPLSVFHLHSASPRPDVFECRCAVVRSAPDCEERAAQYDGEAATESQHDLHLGGQRPLDFRRRVEERTQDRVWRERLVEKLGPCAHDSAEREVDERRQVGEVAVRHICAFVPETALEDGGEGEKRGRFLAPRPWM